ncbi:PAS/PAC sensor signal transduction histidine kinase [Fibrella aestuarina BUZ 2]|uniref:histidine kinase n=1 Tax=Fibrella aestuarina BUZ 2 TaxID=1166018 RepID=I0KEI1_9BACT|nr:PAS domain-containing sensor histidine kinase [Fibrella aestuarina]CCH02534.1 PAS/PAC sensor signal transduction histidine kinase [Fibrella aestuarina BUZ 2]
MQTESTGQIYASLWGNGEMARLMRQKEWSQSRMGTPDTWPQSLRTALSILMRSRFPMFIFWGPDLICFYNDAYRPSLGNNGKHPSALGEPGEQVWPEIWGIIKPLIDQIMAGGDATWSEDQLIPIYRNGQLEDVYWTFSYSPIGDEAGQISGVFVTCMETTKVVQDQQRMAENSIRLNLALEASKLGVWEVDLVRNKSIRSLRHDEIFGYTRPQTAWEKDEFYSHIPVSDHARVEAAFMYAFREGMLNVQTPIIKADGSMAWVDIRGQTLFDETGQAVRLLGTIADITEQQRAAENLESLVAERTESLRQANQALERSNLDLMQFASVASHDLKEPLRKVQTFGTRLTDLIADRLTATEADLFQRMISATGRMQTLVNDVLQLSQLSDQTIRFEPVPLNGIIDQIRDDLELVMLEQQATLTATDLPAVWGAAGQMHQLFLNLIGNAIKFQAGHRPVITVSVVAASAVPHRQLPPDQYAVIAVSDNGIGFDTKHKDRIFGMFQRLHNRGQYAGTGIGLTIVKKIVDNHKGFIDVQSEPGAGTTFWIALPLQALA